MKTQKDVKHNTVYYADWHGVQYLVLYDETKIGRDFWLRIKNKEYGGGGAFSQNYQFLQYLHHQERGIRVREAFADEAMWLRNCIAAGKYVDRPTEVVINNYEIY